MIYYLYCMSRPRDLFVRPKMDTCTYYYEIHMLNFKRNRCWTFHHGNHVLPKRCRNWSPVRIVVRVMCTTRTMMSRVVISLWQLVLVGPSPGCPCVFAADETAQRHGGRSQVFREKNSSSLHYCFLRLSSLVLKKEGIEEGSQWRQGRFASHRISSHLAHINE